MHKATLETLYDKLGYTFKKPDLLKLALTHRSYSVANNERLEFLGDSILDFVIAEVLYHHFPEGSEGELSRLRAYLVQAETLTEIARHLELGSFLQLGYGESKTGGASRDSILADSVESIIAAIFLDSNFEIARQFVLALFHEKLQHISLQTNTKDSKTQLQEYLQAQKYPLPTYDVVATEGEHHQQTFKIRCRITGLKFETYGTSTSRRKAEQIAAEAFLKKMIQ